MCTLPVSYIFDFRTCQFMCYRHVHEANQFADFSFAMSTSNLWKHLTNEHLEQWITFCNDLKIEITAQVVLPAVKKFHQEPIDIPLKSKCPEDLKEAFVEAIPWFIVGDNQVCAYFIISIKFNIGLGHHCCWVRKIFLLLCEVRYS